MSLPGPSPRTSPVPASLPHPMPFPGRGVAGAPRPIIVGSGPAGLFCALILAENGYKPIVLERGQDVDGRGKSVATFLDSGRLDPESNIQFGEGGAGTYSDGKLNTTVTDEFHRNAKILEEFVEAGAPAEIRYLGKPHIGTDYLVRVVKALREKIEALGGEVRFGLQGGRHPGKGWQGGGGGFRRPPERQRGEPRVGRGRPRHRPLVPGYPPGPGPIRAGDGAEGLRPGAADRAPPGDDIAEAVRRELAPPRPARRGLQAHPPELRRQGGLHLLHVPWRPRGQLELRGRHGGLQWHERTLPGIRRTPTAPSS